MMIKDARGSNEVAGRKVKVDDGGRVLVEGGVEVVFIVFFQSVEVEDVVVGGDREDGAVGRIGDFPRDLLGVVDRAEELECLVLCDLEEAHFSVVVGGWLAVADAHGEEIPRRVEAAGNGREV